MKNFALSGPIIFITLLISGCAQNIIPTNSTVALPKTNSNHVTSEIADERLSNQQITVEKNSGSGGQDLSQNKSHQTVKKVGIFTVTGTGVFTEAGDIIEADVDTFATLGEGVIGGDSGKFHSRNSFYYDKEYLYYFLLYDGWSRVKLHTPSIHNVANSNYFFAGEDLYYNGLPLFPIRKIEYKPTSKAIDSLIFNEDFVVIGNTLYYKGIPLVKENINIPSIQVSQDSKYFSTGNRIFFFGLEKLIELKGADVETFKKINDGTYEDKNASYVLMYGHHGFDIKIVGKNNSYNSCGQISIYNGEEWYSDFMQQFSSKKENKVSEICLSSDKSILFVLTPGTYCTAGRLFQYNIKTGVLSEVNFNAHGRECIVWPSKFGGRNEKEISLRGTGGDGGCTVTMDYIFSYLTNKIELKKECSMCGEGNTNEDCKIY